jgi:hypothetical protein
MPKWLLQKQFHIMRTSVASFATPHFLLRRSLLGFLLIAAAPLRRHVITSL